MEKRIVLSMVLVFLWAGLSACSGASANVNKKMDWWSAFVGEQVVKVVEVYPSGDAPRSLVTTKSGKKIIY